MSFKIVVQVGETDAFRLCPCGCESGAGTGAGGLRRASQESRTWGDPRRSRSRREKPPWKRPTERR